MRDFREFPSSLFVGLITELLAEEGYSVMQENEDGELTDNPKVSLADVRALDQWRDVIPEYVKDYVSLNAFAA